MAALTVRDLIDRVLAGHVALALVGEAVADEWQYIVDLQAVWAARLREVATARGDGAASPAATAAIERPVEETASISDPHRAIDWLSTMPVAALLALGEAS